MKTIKDLDYSFNHTKERILERYDFKITRPFYDNMCKDIQNQSSDVHLIDIEKQKDDTQIIFDVTYKFIDPIRVVWSEKRKCVTTALKIKR